MTDYQLKIKMHIVDGAVWFCAKDIAKVLGYKNTNIAIREHVENSNKTKFSNLNTTENVSYNKGIAIYINKKGLIALLISSRMPNKCDFINWCTTNHSVDISVLTRLYKEQETIGQLIKVFGYKKYYTQFMADTYRLDLYFPEDKLAVECDEFGHQDRDQEYERAREMYIRKTLNCKFIRYNPDEPNFSIFNVIRQIIAEMYEAPPAPCQK